MAENVKEVKLKDGSLMNYLKTGEKHMFFNKLIAMTSWQLYILIFIILIVILFAIVQVMFMGESFNKLLYEIQVIQYQIQQLQGNVTVLTPIPYSNDGQG